MSLGLVELKLGVRVGDVYVVRDKVRKASRGLVRSVILVVIYFVIESMGHGV